MNRVLQIEPFSGISGDMFLGALAPLLDAERELRDLPRILGLNDVEVNFEDVTRSTLHCRKATVTVGGEAPEARPGAHHHHHHHHEDHDPSHGHTHRAYRDIVGQIGASGLSDGVKQRALDLFRILGEAEAAMHGTDLDDVHFHEVGGEDALIDLVGAALLLDKLDPDQVFCTPVCVGSGFVHTAHGRLPVPAPATQRLLEGMPAFAGPIDMEMTTPTGAAILRHLNPDFSSPVLTASATGLGAGTRDPHSQPNALRVSLCSPGSGDRETITLLQTNLDNLRGEDLGTDTLQDVLEAGALDVWLVPVIMKKGRPGQVLNLLCRTADAESLSRFLLLNLPTLGVRRLDGTRIVLQRSTETVSTSYGDIEVKVHHLPDGSARRIPEYESCRRAAAKHDVPISRVRRAAE